VIGENGSGLCVVAADAAVAESMSSTATTAIRLLMPAAASPIPSAEFDLFARLFKAAPCS
jgi:hypothetical protein